MRALSTLGESSGESVSCSEPNGMLVSCPGIKLSSSRLLMLEWSDSCPLSRGRLLAEMEKKLSEPLEVLPLPWLSHDCRLASLMFLGRSPEDPSLECSCLWSTWLLTLSPFRIPSPLVSDFSRDCRPLGWGRGTPRGEMVGRLKG